MKFISFLFGIVVGAAVVWLYLDRSRKVDVEYSRARVAEGAERVKEGVSEKLQGLSFNTDEIKDELSKSGKVVRKKTKELGTALADKTSDARITAAIKGKYAVESDVSAINISVSTTEGVVTLAGTANSPEEIAKAMRLALEVDGTREVISALQLKTGK